MTASDEYPGRDDLSNSGMEPSGSLRLLANWGADYVDTTGDIPPDQRERYLSNLRRRAGREPLQYILGATEFMSLPFRTPRGVFVPRPDTEVLVELSEAKLRGIPLSSCIRALDLCCGSGVIAVSLAHCIPNLEVWAVDRSARAVDASAENAAANGVGTRVHPVRADADRFLAAGPGGGPANPAEGSPQRFSAVVCNPPYIPTPDVSNLPPEVREHEPIEALDGGPDGLRFYRRIVPMLPGRLEAGGFAAFEIGDTQGEAVSAIMSEAGFAEVSIMPDYAGLDRVVTGIQPA